jgi:hypothetical protein
MQIYIITLSSICLLLHKKFEYRPIVFWSIYIYLHEDMKVEERMPETLVMIREHLIQYRNSDQDFNV